MDSFAVALNNILVEVYHNILHLEEQALKNSNKIQLSISEMHLIEVVGEKAETGCTISEIARKLKITRPSATIAVNKLEKKGYVEKFNCENDGRFVRVHLTKEGSKINAFHSYYHHNMVKEISEEFTEEEKVNLIKVIERLNNYFKRALEKNDDI